MKFFLETRPNSIMFQHTYNLDFPAHLHTEIELGYCEAGRSNLYVEDKKYEINQGDFFIIFPNQIHRYEASINISVLMVIFSPENIPEFSKIFKKNVPVSPIINTYNKQSLSLIKFIEETDKIKYQTEIINGLSTALCGNLFDSMILKRREEIDNDTLKNILIFCDEHFSEPISIEDVAKNLFISRSHIAHVFKNKINSTFSKYITYKRIELACRMIKDTNYSITDIAFSTGFNSIRTFNRVFIKNVGCSPREFRK